MSPLSVSSLPEGSTALRWSFTTLALLVVVLFVGAVYASARRSGRPLAEARRQGAIAALLAGLWLSVTGIAAARGTLHFEPPPTMALVLVATFVTAFAIAWSPLGRRLALDLPIAALVGFQAFRIGVELLMHRAWSEGLMPVQMSYSGRNFDIVSGITAAVVGLWLARGRTPSWLVGAWNTLGLALLLNIIGVALLSAPGPLRVFMNEPANVWITRAPWVWLPAVMVLAALLGHLLVYRRLLAESRRTQRAGLPVSVAALALLLVLGTTACTDSASAPPTEPASNGTLQGSVTLLGVGGPPNPVAVSVSLFRSEADMESRNKAYESMLTPGAGTPRTFCFAFPKVEPGHYYVLACFAFGCAPYQDLSTGQPLRVHVDRGPATQLDFGI